MSVELLSNELIGLKTSNEHPITRCVRLKRMVRLRPDGRATLAKIVYKEAMNLVLMVDAGPGGHTTGSQQAFQDDLGHRGGLPVKAKKLNLILELKRARVQIRALAEALTQPC